jgi:cyclophilin family peptidyl-prolyl cis-trans isomerase
MDTGARREAWPEHWDTDNREARIVFGESSMLKKVRLTAMLALGLLFSLAVNATVVQFQTNLGAFEVNLYDQRTPATVANFLEYVESGAYENVVIHRSVADFVIQGGGFVSTGGLPLGLVATNAAVANEPEFSNVRGTIAMAKLSGDPNSATSQWYFNLVDNSESLDPQNGGFTVFGEVVEVVGGGMEIVDAIAALPVFNADGPLSSLPLQNYTAQNADDGVAVTDEHLVLVTAIVVIDAAADTAAGLSPAENTLIDPPASPPPVSDGGGGGGGGSTGLVSLVFLLGVFFARRGRVRVRRSEWPGDNAALE